MSVVVRSYSYSRADEAQTNIWKYVGLHCGIPKNPKIQRVFWTVDITFSVEKGSKYVQMNRLAETNT